MPDVDANEPLSLETVDAKLDDVAIKQLLWKPSQMRDVACSIVGSMLYHRVAYADEVSLPALKKDDVNAVGSSWRNLTRTGIVEKTGRFRRSKKEASNGRTVWEYRLMSERLAYTFLKRNGGVPCGRQPELAL